MPRPKLISWFIRITLALLFLLTGGILLLLFYTTPVTQHTDTCVYSLPFKKGTKYKVVQGYGGLFSHRHIAALDFGMPEGTPVCAARGGDIYSYKDDSDEGGIFPGNKNKANYIIIRHDDGSYGCYWHLQLHGVLIKTGHVEEGQMIGLSGATGQVFRPHLHFSVKRVLNYDMNSFVQTKFKTSGGIVFLKNGNSYEKPSD